MHILQKLQKYIRVYQKWYKNLDFFSLFFIIIIYRPGTPQSIGSYVKLLIERESDLCVVSVHMEGEVNYCAL